MPVSSCSDVDDYQDEGGHCNRNGTLNNVLFVVLIDVQECRILWLILSLCPLVLHLSPDTQCPH